MIVAVLRGARGTGRLDDVPHALDAAANGRDQDFQLDRVREGSAELGVTPVRAESLVIDVSRQVLGSRVTAVRGDVGACCAVVVCGVLRS